MMVINNALKIKIPFLVVFRNLSVVFSVALNNYRENRKMTSLKYYLDPIC